MNVELVHLYIYMLKTYYYSVYIYIYVYMYLNCILYIYTISIIYIVYIISYRISMTYLYILYMWIIFPSQSHQVSPAAPEERRLRHSRPFVGHRYDLLQEVAPCNVFSASVGTGKQTRGCGKPKLSLGKSSTKREGSR